GSFHLRARWLELERFLIKLSRAFLVRNGNGNKCDFFNHMQGPFSFSGFNLCMTMLFPSGSLMIAIQQQGLSYASTTKGTCRSFNDFIASSKFSTSNAAPVPCSEGSHCGPTLAIARVLFPSEYSTHFPLIISSETFRPSTPS